MRDKWPKLRCTSMKRQHGFETVWNSISIFFTFSSAYKCNYLHFFSLKFFLSIVSGGGESASLLYPGSWLSKLIQCLIQANLSTIYTTNGSSTPIPSKTEQGKTLIQSQRVWLSNTKVANESFKKLKMDEMFCRENNVNAQRRRNQRIKSLTYNGRQTMLGDY